MFVFLIIFSNTTSIKAQNEDWTQYSKSIKKFTSNGFKKMYRESGGSLKYPFLTPGSAYEDQLWDWDSYFANVALRQILTDHDNKKDKEEIVKYEQGCVLNFLGNTSIDGWIPIVIQKESAYSELMSGFLKPKDLYSENMHKPILAQHAAFLVKINNGDAEWLRSSFPKLEFFISNYLNHRRNFDTGLFFWTTDHFIGVDNDPSTFYRPNKSSGSIYLNSLVYKELKAIAYIAEQLNLPERVAEYNKEADKLKDAIQENCWDPRDGSFYSVDLNLLPKKQVSWVLHSGSPRHYNCLIQRIDSWSNFLPLWAGIATQEQAKEIVSHFNNKKTFNAPYGVRTLSKMEKMYNLKASGNPSNWQGPIWGISNYLVWKGLVEYGFDMEAKEIAVKTIILFGKDIEKNGTLHEYYNPDNGEPILHPGFQNWNYLVLNMIAWMEGRPVIEEF